MSCIPLPPLVSILPGLLHAQYSSKGFPIDTFVYICVLSVYVRVCVRACMVCVTWYEKTGLYIQNTPIHSTFGSDNLVVW